MPNNITLLISVYYGEIWKSIKLKENGFVLPIALYFNNFEINNPLGSCKSIHKLGIVYLSLLDLSPQYIYIYIYIYTHTEGAV